MKFHLPRKIIYIYAGFGYGHTMFDLEDRIVLFADWDAAFHAPREEDPELLAKVRHDIANIQSRYQVGRCVLYTTKSGYHGIFTEPVTLREALQIYHGMAGREISSRWAGFYPEESGNSGTDLADSGDSEDERKHKDLLREESVAQFLKTGQPKYWIGHMCAGFCGFAFKCAALYLRTGCKTTYKDHDIERLTPPFADEPEWVHQHDKLIKEKPNGAI